MISRPLVMGALGGMGKRYCAILKYLGVDFIGIDRDDVAPKKGRFDGVLIATPTHMHLQHIRRVWDYGVPILCEKPIGTDIDDVLTLCRDAASDGVKLRAVNQYAQLVPGDACGDTSYDCWRTGGDGLAWDCTSIIGLARGPIALANRSPVWRCTINGQVLNLADMDFAYVTMLQGWLSGDVDGIDYIRKSHLKVQEYMDTHA